MIFDHLRYLLLDDPDRYAKLMLMYPIPERENVWGIFAPIRDTPWGKQIPVVSGEALSHALHGYVRPLCALLGNPPRARALALPLVSSVCREHKTCSIATAHCNPGSSLMPACYVPPSEDASRRGLLGVIARAWAEGRYVVVVDGPEHVVT